jgi:hypothetical protein
MDVSLATLQEQRTGRAREMLESGTVLITKNGPGAWTVQNGDGEPYSVALDGKGRFACSCMDYQRQGRNGIRCKHVESVRLSEEQSKPIESNHKGGTTMNEPIEQGWVKLYHPLSGGIQVTLPLPVSLEKAKEIFGSLSHYLQAGFMANQAGLEEGETREPVTCLARRQKKNNDDSISPIIDVYTSNGNFRTISIYLDSTDEIDEFFQAVQIPLKSIQLFDGDSPIERGKNPERDKKYIVPVTGLEVVYKRNPKWEGDEDKKHPKRIFVRWERKDRAPNPSESTGTATQPELQSNNQTPPPPPPPQSQTMTVRKYLDGSLVSPNKAEVEAFDNFMKAEGKAPVSVNALRSWVA